MKDTAPEQEKQNIASSVQQDGAAARAGESGRMYLRYESDYSDFDGPSRKERVRRFSEAYRNTPEKDRKPSTAKHVRTWAVRLAVIAAVSLFAVTGLYHIASYSTLPFIAEKRTELIESIWETKHRYLAYIFPEEVVAERVKIIETRSLEHIGENSTELPPWMLAKETEAETAEIPPETEETALLPEETEPLLPVPVDAETETVPPETEPVETEPPVDTEKLAFYELFHELDETSMEAYLERFPSAVQNGYSHIRINEAGLDDDGTDIYTVQGDQVLAVDAENQILLVRVRLEGTPGVLAIAKDPSRLHMCPSDGLKYFGYGQTVETLANKNNGVLAMTGSAFIDPEGMGNGGQLAGFCRCDGVSYGTHRGWGLKRIELDENNCFSITDAPRECPDNVTDATEFEPALVLDGRAVNIGDWNGKNPRACIGQDIYGGIMMLVMEGRLSDAPGCSLLPCRDKLLEYDCWVAMNLDGGTSALMWYDGEEVTRCSNRSTPHGRPMPSVWVYGYEPVD